MISFLLTHKSKIIKFLLMLVLLTFFGTFITTPTGQNLFSSLMKEFPFFNFIYSTYNKIRGYESQLPDISFDYFITQTIKLIVISLVSALCFSLLTRLFNYIRVPKNQILATNFLSLSENMELKTNTPIYKLKHSIISIVSEFIGVYIGSFVIKAINSILNNIQDHFKKTVVTVLLFVIFYLGYCVIQSVLSQITLTFSFIKNFIYSLLPEILSTFVTTSLMLLIYFSIKNEGFGTITIIFIIALFIWCVLSDLLCSELKILLLQQSNGQKSKFDLSNCLCTTTFYLYGFIFYFLGHVAAGQESYFDLKLTKIFFAYNDLPFFQIIKNHGSFLSLSINEKRLLFAEVPKSIVFSIMVSVFQKMLTGKKGLFRYFADCLTLALSIMSYSMLLYGYNNIHIFPVIILGLLIILMLTKKFYSIVNFPEFIVSSIVIFLVALGLSTILAFTVESMITISIIVFISTIAWYIIRKFTQ